MPSDPTCHPARIAAERGGDPAWLPPPRAPRLLLFGVPAMVAEPTTLLAEILGWEVVELAGAPAMRPPADLCLATLPADPGVPMPPIIAWSPDNNLNEHISRAGLSRLEHPPCIQHLEQLLQIASDLA